MSSQFFSLKSTYHAFSTFMTYKRCCNDLQSCLTILKCQIMTYMHFDVFPADSLGWLCRALNTRDNVCDSLVHISGKSTQRHSCRAPICLVKSARAHASRKVTNHNGVGLAGGGRGGGEGRNRALTENAESAQMRGRVSRKSTSFFCMVKHDYQPL